MELKKKIDALRKERYIQGLDEKPAAYKEILGAAFRFQPLLDILKKAEFKPVKQKKAQMSGTFNIFTFMIFAFLVVVFFAGLIYSMQLIADVMHNAGLSNEVNAGKPSYVNMTKAADDIFGSQAQSIKALRMVSIVYILGLAVVIIVTNIFVRKHPIFFFAQILISILAIIFAPPISNAYENLLGSGIYGGELMNFGASNFILLNLPTIVLVISVLGIVLSLINIIRTGDTNVNL